ncbi:hypothetical protein ACFLT5_01805 [Chloroflexota bacterium]
MELNRVAVSRTSESLWTGQESDPVLAAAIAALLVEYQRKTDQRDDPSDSQSTRTNWRLLSRWEQLRG